MLGRVLKPYFRCMRNATVPSLDANGREQRGQAESGYAAGASSSREETYSALWQHACQPSALARGVLVHVICLYSKGDIDVQRTGVGCKRDVLQTSNRRPKCSQGDVQLPITQDV